VLLITAIIPEIILAPANSHMGSYMGDGSINVANFWVITI